MKYSIIVLFIGILFTNCKTLKESDYTPSLNQEKFLPSLRAEYDIDNLYIVYAYGKFTSEISKKTMDSKLMFNDLKQKSKPFVNDIVKSYKFEASQIIDSSPTTDGSVKLFVHNFHSKHTGDQAFFVIYTQLWLLGVPITTVKINLEIELVVSNNTGEIIKSYKAKGNGRSIAAAYWSYGIINANRKANLLAFQQAMEKIKNEMKTDMPFLQNKLETN